MLLTKISKPEDFKHLLWRRHPDSASHGGFRPEILATDGRTVRRLSSQHQYISYQEFEDRNSAEQIASKIETSVMQGVALLGYSMFTDHEALAILHTASGLEPGWVAFPHKRSQSSAVPTLPMSVADVPKLRLVGGASTKYEHRGHVLKGALEQRGGTFLNSRYAFNILDHVETWSIAGRVGREPAKEIRLQLKKTEPTLKRVSEFRLEGTFELDEALFTAFKDDPSFRVWFIVQFSKDLFCLPGDWLRFWLHVEL